jgi:hypothetical protein
MRLLTSSKTPCEPYSEESNECRNNTKEYLENSVSLHVLSSWLTTSVLVGFAEVEWRELYSRPGIVKLVREAGSYDEYEMETLLSRVCVLVAREL